MASKYDGATLEVINWGTYNPRTDSKRPTWFRFENEIATGPGFFGLDCEIKWLWIFILSLVSQKNGEPVIWNAAYCQSVTGIKQAKQDEAIEVFEKFVRLRVSREVTNVIPIASTPLRDETDETDGRDSTWKSDAHAQSRMPPLTEIWNKHRGQLSEVRGCSGTRLKSAKARWEENPSTEYWAEIVIRIARSDFCNGKGSTGWRADFDFLIKPDSQHKVLEGKYDGRGDAQGGYVDPEILKIRQQLDAEDANGSA